MAQLLAMPSLNLSLDNQHLGQQNNWRVVNGRRQFFFFLFFTQILYGVIVFGDPWFYDATVLLSLRHREIINQTCHMLGGWIVDGMLYYKIL